MDAASIRHGLRGKMNSMKLSVALLPGVDADEALVYLEHIACQCQQVIELIEELQAIPAPEGQTPLIDHTLLTPPEATPPEQWSA